jgi:hypothetical protein
MHVRDFPLLRKGRKFRATHPNEQSFIKNRDRPRLRARPTTPAAVIRPFRKMTRPVRTATAYREHIGRIRPITCLAFYPQSEYSCPLKSNIGNTVIETESFI